MIDPLWLEDLCEQLSTVAPVTIKRMFGGAGVYARGYFFAVIDDDAIYFKADDVNRPDFEALRAPRFAPAGYDGLSMSYYEVPETILEHPVQLRRLMEGAIEAAMRARSLPSRRKKGAATSSKRAKSPIRKPGKLQSSRKTPPKAVKSKAAKSARKKTKRKS